ncbi:hypothetical protein [Caudoviricetes sp.]|nr:hypothetical protein [Caudoviricetes sp.]
MCRKVSNVEINDKISKIRFFPLVIYIYIAFLGLFEIHNYWIFKILTLN